MKLNPKKISMFRKKAKLQIAAANDMEELGALLGDAFNEATGLIRIGLIGKTGVGKTTLAQGWIDSAQPLRQHFSHTLIGRPQTIWANDEHQTWLRHFDTSATRFASNDDKEKLSGFSAYFRDVNPDGLDIVEHPEFEKDRETGQNTDNYDYLFKIVKPSLKSDMRKVLIYPSASELKSERFEQILENTGATYGYF